MKKKENSRRKVGIAVLLLLLIIGVGTYTYSRYTSSATANSTASIAKWAVKVNGTDFSTTTQTLTPTITWDTNEFVADGKIAPGRTGTFTIELDPTGSEVAIDYVLKIDSSAITGITNSASKISVTGATYKVGDGESQSATITGSDGITITEALADVQANKTVTVTVTIGWDNDSDKQNTADTENGATAGDIIVPTTITAKQHIS